MNFVHLHNHTHYSLLDGLARPIDLIKKAKEQNSPAIAITDHGVMYGVIEFYKLAKENDIKPIIGVEAYINPISRFNRDKNSKYYHLILLAYSNQGYQNLLKLTTFAHLEGFYYKPRIDFELLKEYHHGLIASSACLQGHVAQTYLAKGEERALEIIKTYQDVFGTENFFLELQHHPEIEEQNILNQGLITLSQKSGCPLIITNDAHYADATDAEAHDVLICIQTQKSVDDHDRLKYISNFCLKDPKEILAAFPNQKAAFQNTAEIANRCQVEIKLGQNLIPSFQTAFNKKPHEYLRELCYEGIKERFNQDINENIINRLEFELDVIHKMAFDTYFLIVHDIISFARAKNIVIGPGRGSAAGSMVAYTLKITNLNPLKYGLLFERFLNPERISMPDIDIDFADNRRNEILEYISLKYGKNHVAQIITFGTMAARASVRDAGRALGYPYLEVDKIAKLIPPPILGKHQPLKKSINTDHELKNLYQKESRVKKLLDMAIKLEGTVRHAGTHACAVVISKEPLVEYCPIQKAPKEGQEVITQYSMKPLEEIGLLKMDFLGLKNLTTIETTLNLIKKRHNLLIDINTLPLDDQKTFDLLKKGETIGVFQLESAGMRRYLKELKPTSFEDLIAMISLYRPGPMEWIPDYIKRKHGQTEITYLHPSLEAILNETYGIGIYQEQILEIAQKFAGFSLGEADLLRRAIGKKIAKELAGKRKEFIEGALKMGNNKKLAIAIFEKVIEPFAGYGFNKSHAACYAMISYQTAYLKAHFPVEFLCALLSSDSSDTDRIVIEIQEANRLGIEVLPPSVNESESNFTVIDQNHIRFGLNAIKGLGDQFTQTLILERNQNQPYQNIEEFIRRLPEKLLNKKNLESLAYSGALDTLCDSNTVIKNSEEILKFARSCHEIKKTDQQTDIFDFMPEDQGSHIKLKLKHVKPASRLDKLIAERKFLGLYVSGHPLDGLKKYFNKKAHLISNLDKKFIEKIITICGIISNLKRITTKNGKVMLTGNIEDPTGKIRFIVFPKTYLNLKEIISEDQLFSMQGKLESQNQELQVVVEECRAVSLEKIIDNANQEGLFDPKQKVLNLDTILNEELKELNPSNPHAQKILPYIIKIPLFASQSNLEILKNLLYNHPGPTKVEIHILAPDQVKKVQVPFNVEVSEILKKEINDLFSLAHT